MTPIQLSLPGYKSDGAPSFHGELQRINVILGANGSGKSKFLEYLLQALPPDVTSRFQIVRVDAARARVVPASVGVSQETAVHHTNVSLSEEQHKRQRNQLLSNRVTLALIVIHLKDIAERANHSDVIAAMQNAGEIGNFPTRAETSFERLQSLMGRSLPELSLSRGENNQLVVTKLGSVYNASVLSDGEKQVLVLLAEIAVLGADNSIYLVDEPELNLHPSLAETLWATLEDAFPNSLFVYATDSLSFVSRPVIDQVFTIANQEIKKLDLGDGSFEIGPFLGSMPSISRNRNCLFVEGTDLSFDPIFYRWICGRGDLGVYPVGGCSEVIAAAKKKGLWSQIASGTTTRGVIDLDHGADAPGYETIRLSLHEAESYLCHPDVLQALWLKTDADEEIPGREHIVKLLVEQAKSRFNQVLAHRVFARLTFGIGVSVEKTELRDIQSVEELCATIAGRAETESAKANRILHTEAVTELVTSEAGLCQNAIDTKNTDELLRIFEGKFFAHQICKRAGYASPTSMLMALKKHHSINEFPHLEVLSRELKNLFDFT